MQKEIVDVRIDDRLIHGQIAAAWTKNLEATRIMVIDAEAAKTELQRIALKMACPIGIKLSILSPQKALENLASGKYAGERIMIVMRGTETLLTLSELGFSCDVVNVGNMSGRTGTRQIKKGVNITAEDETIFRKLSGSMRFDARLVPNEAHVDFMALL